MKVKECIHCGARSVPWFGFTSPCDARGRIGSHRETVPIEEDDNVSLARFWRAYQNAPAYDRANFHAHADAEYVALYERARALQ